MFFLCFFFGLTFINSVAQGQMARPICLYMYVRTKGNIYLWLFLSDKRQGGVMLQWLKLPAWKNHSLWHSSVKEKNISSPHSFNHNIMRHRQAAIWSPIVTLRGETEGYFSEKSVSAGFESATHAWLSRAVRRSANPRPLPMIYMRRDGLISIGVTTSSQPGGLMWWRDERPFLSEILRLRSSQLFVIPIKKIICS